MSMSIDDSVQIHDGSGMPFFQTNDIPLRQSRVSSVISVRVQVDAVSIFTGKGSQFDVEGNPIAIKCLQLAQGLSLVARMHACLGPVRIDLRHKERIYIDTSPISDRWLTTGEIHMSDSFRDHRNRSGA